MKTPCYVCKKEMTIDEPNGESYHTDNVIIVFEPDGYTVKSRDESQRKIRHETCVGD